MLYFLLNDDLALLVCFDHGAEHMIEILYFASHRRRTGHSSIAFTYVLLHIFVDYF